MSALIHSQVARTPARVYCGEWISDCPYCLYAVGGPKLPYGTSAFGCPECGATVEVVWPTVEKAHAIARLLAMRPIRYTRNWNPDETLHDLAAENAAHGIFTPLLEGLSDTPLIIDDAAIRVDQLPAIGSPMLQAIGA